MTNRKRLYFVFLFISISALVASCSKTQQPETSLPNSATSANVADSDVNEHVKTALNQHSALKAFDIQVITLKGDVRLIGVVDTQAHIDQAVAIARSADGAHTIHNELTIKQ